MPEPKQDSEEVISRGPQQTVITGTARETMGSVMDNLGLGAPAPEEESSGDSSETNPSLGLSDDEGSGGDVESGEEGGGDSGGDSEERPIETTHKLTEEILEEASVEGVEEEVDILNILNSLAGKLDRREPESEGEPAPPEKEEAVVAPVVAVPLEISEEDFNKAFSSREGLQEVLSNAVGNGVAASQQQMMSNISMAVGKVVADSVELYVEYHAVKSRHPIVAKYPDAYRYAVTEVETVNPDWSRDKVLTHAVARLKLYEKAAAKQEGKVVDVEDKPGGKPGKGSSVRQAKFTKESGGDSVVDATKASLISHVKSKNDLQARLGGK